ncbi:MAG: hypothetical protein FWC64_06935 [Treponema sp.]|nr:hypothetical protein [Treponema sp.]
MNNNVNPAAIKLPLEYEGRRFFTTAEFGAMVGKTSATIRRWGRLGYISLRRITPTCVMVPLSELERFTRGEMMEGDKRPVPPEINQTKGNM